MVKRIAQLKGYLQTHRIPFVSNNSSYDGEAEVRLEDLEALASLREAPEFPEGGARDEPDAGTHSGRAAS